MIDLLKSALLATPPGRRIRHRIDALQARIDELEAAAAACPEPPQSAPPKPAPPQPAVEPAPPPVRLAHMIDALWRDTYGVYVRGWVHAFEHRVRRIVLSSGDAVAATGEFEDRPDVLTHYPDYPHAHDCGFRLYLPAPPLAGIELRVETEAGVATIEPDVPKFQVQDPSAPAESHEPALRRLMAHVRERQGTVVELGGRHVGAEHFDWAAQVAPEGRYIAADIHAAPEVDLVVDAHFLSRSIAPGSLDGLYSTAVLEHVAAPWLVAAEINRVLSIGGMTLHAVPHSWPVHETPNDFWRFSEAGLSVLFGPATGFEVLECGLSYPTYMPPPVNKRSLPWCEHGIFPGYMEAWILARKVRELPEGVVAWPAETLAAISQAYPRAETGPG